MNKTICPGQDTRFWRPGDIFDIKCASCGKSVEFFKDEARRRCPNCGARIMNPRLALGCAQWCEHARECLGFDPKQLDEEGEDDQLSLVERLTEEIKKVFKDDRKRINHALAVLERSRQILHEEHANPRVVLAAALLHDIGIKQAEKKYGSAAGVYQEKEGPPIAEAIMKDLGLDPETIEHVSRIVGSHHSARDIDTPEFRVIWDADWLVNIPDEFPGAGKDQLAAKIEKIMKTEAGKRMAYQTYIEGDEAQGPVPGEDKNVINL